MVVASISTMTAKVERGAKEGEGVVNEHAPPSSAEEAAALLGAAISFDAQALSSPKDVGGGGGRSNPPLGMHSVFTVQTPVPNQVLFVRLINLRAWLRWHADVSHEVDGLDVGVSEIMALVIIFDVCNIMAGAHLLLG